MAKVSEQTTPLTGAAAPTTYRGPQLPSSVEERVSLLHSYRKGQSGLTSGQRSLLRNYDAELSQRARAALEAMDQDLSAKSSVAPAYFGRPILLQLPANLEEFVNTLIANRSRQEGVTLVSSLPSEDRELIVGITYLKGKIAARKYATWAQSQQGLSASMSTSRSGVCIELIAAAVHSIQTTPAAPPRSIAALDSPRTSGRRATDKPPVAPPNYDNWGAQNRAIMGKTKPTPKSPATTKP